MSEGRSLFDTGALLDIYRGRSRVRPYFDQLFDEAIVAYISPITEAELWLGLRPDELERHKALLAFFVSLPLTSQSARLAGEWMRRFGSAGLGWMDALIVASAAVLNIAVLTRDRRLARLLGDEAELIVYA
jgi:predicted nucleic acid-binding protein